MSHIDLRALRALVFSVASIWEVVIKHGVGRRDFRIDPQRLRRRLIENGFTADRALAQYPVTIVMA